MLLRALAARLDAVSSIGISAGAFALYHLNPPQVISTFGLGLALGFVTLRARSILPAMIVHAINNSVAIVISRDEVPPLGAWMTAHPTISLASSLLVISCGLALAAKGAA
jgi:membrane protease YdiL (CAAX protease family)